MAEYCGTCRFFSETSGHSGLCRAHPPSLHADGGGRWPGVVRNDWCGEYRAQPPAPVAGIRKAPAFP